MPRRASGAKTLNEKSFWSTSGPGRKRARSGFWTRSESLVALAIGLCVSALRFFLFEKLLCRKHKFPAHMFSKLAAEGRLASFKAVVDEHYRYHQFYGGCAVAVLILYTGWFRYAIDDANLRFVLVSVAFALFELLLIVTGTDAFIRYVERGTIIVNGG